MRHFKNILYVSKGTSTDSEALNQAVALGDVIENFI